VGCESTGPCLKTPEVIESNGKNGGPGRTRTFDQWIMRYAARIRTVMDFLVALTTTRHDQLLGNQIKGA
jgi:hypothetical protein